MVGESEKGLSAFDRYVDFYRKQETDDGRRYSGRLAQISLVLLRYEQAAKAESYLRECLKIRETQFPDHWLLENTKSMLGGAMTMQRKFSEAEPLLIEGYRRLKIHEEGIPARARVRIVEALERLVDLYNAWEKPEEVAKWRTELQKKKVERK